MIEQEVKSALHRAFDEARRSGDPGVARAVYDASRVSFTDFLTDLAPYVAKELTLVGMDFIECETCAAKSGSPQLCPSCLHNRTLISRLKGMVRHD